MRRNSLPMACAGIALGVGVAFALSDGPVASKPSSKHSQISAAGVDHAVTDVTASEQRDDIGTLIAHRFEGRGPGNAFGGPATRDEPMGTGLLLASFDPADAGHSQSLDDDLADEAFGFIPEAGEIVAEDGQEPRFPESVDLAFEEPAAPAPLEIVVKSGATLTGLMTRAGLPEADIRAAIKALRTTFDPRDLRAGHRISIYRTPVPSSAAPTTTLTPDSLASQAAEDATAPAAGLSRLLLHIAADREIAVSTDDGLAFTAAVHQRQLDKEPRFASGQITSSFYVAGRKQDVPADTLVSMIHAFSYDVDFQRDIRAGNRFEVLYERESDPRTGRLVRGGPPVYAALLSGDELLTIYRYTDSDGVTEYYDAKGRSARKALMRTPIDGARLSSGYGMRIHPILGYSKMHRGLDFAAPTGTPIYAAGDGMVEVSGWRGGYGRYIRIRHGGGFKTAYAHMRRIHKRAKVGKRVRQGDVIGYVGSSGRSTGPHLHYEIHKDGKIVNPMKVRTPTIKPLKGEELERFEAWRDEIDAQIARLSQAPVLAQAQRPE